MNTDDQLPTLNSDDNQLPTFYTPTEFVAQYPFVDLNRLFGFISYHSEALRICGAIAYEMRDRVVFLIDEKKFFGFMLRFHVGYESFPASPEAV